MSFVTSRDASRLAFAFAVACLFLTVGPSLAHAATGGGTMPWDSNVQKISADFTGPVAYAVAIIGCVAAGGMLIFMQELPFFLKAVCFIVLAASFMCGANAFATTMGWTGSIV
jgi:type IV secretion system protein TrbC